MSRRGRPAGGRGGYGALTDRLLRKSRPLVVVEPDPKLRSMLEERFTKATAFQFLQKDILEVDIASFSPPPPGRVTVVGNIPYYLTTPLLIRLLADFRGSLRRIYLMVQKEVADRLEAIPGTKAYGALTVCARYFAEIDVLFRVGAGSFKPKPKVESAFVRLRPKEGLPLGPSDEERLFRLTRAIFQSRRKTLRNSLKLLGKPPDVLDAAIQKAGLRPDIRGETLDLAKLIEISQAIK